jgi:hypothetical protein
MFQLFRQAPASKTLEFKRGFRARAAGRDAETDQSRVHSILQAIENALREAEREHSGLNQRLEDVLARAAATVGNGTDEYLEREPLDSHHQDLFGTEICSGQRRLKELVAAIELFRFLKTTAISRFAELGAMGASDGPLSPK